MTAPSMCMSKSLLILQPTILLALSILSILRFRSTSMTWKLGSSRPSKNAVMGSFRMVRLLSLLRSRSAVLNICILREANKVIARALIVLSLAQLPPFILACLFWSHTFPSSSLIPPKILLILLCSFSNSVLMLPPPRISTALLPLPPIP